MTDPHLAHSSEILGSLLPRFDARERHEVIVRAPAAAVYAAVRTADFGSSWVLRILLALRALPSLLRRRTQRPGMRLRMSLADFVAAGFGIVAEDPGREIVLGVAGRFWRPVPDARPVSDAATLAAPRAGEVAAGWNFVVRQLDQGTCLLSTETRALAADASSRRRFRAYWVVVRPFSGLIRRMMLRAIRHAAEEGALR